MTSLELTSSGTADFDKGGVYFIGNATTLIRFGGLTILTDPAFLHKGEHVFWVMASRPAAKSSRPVKSPTCPRSI